MRVVQPKPYRLTPWVAATRTLCAPIGWGLLVVPGFALAGPTGSEVVGGAAAVSAPDATHTVVTQTSQNAVINWQQFNVGSDEYVIFNQPNASAAVLNRIIGGDASTILGNITANGRVFLINPNGIIFGQGSKIDVGGLVASTLNIKTADFMAGHYVMSGDSQAGVLNNGNITVGEKGFVVLAGDHVGNSGVIHAQLGTVVLVAGSATTLDLNGDGLVSFKIDQAALSDRAGVANLGEIIAQGGTVIMTAKTAGELTRTTVNNSGLIKAHSITEKKGEIYLTAEGGSIANSGTLDASGTNGNNGGDIVIHADGDIAQNGRIQFGGENGGTAHVVAERDLTLGLDSVIDGRVTNSTGKGGSLELSGHRNLKLDGEIQLGKGGALLIDPATITIVSGSGTGTDTINENFIESQLNSNTDVIIAATDSIFASGAFYGAGIDASGTGNLTLGIGTSSYGSFVQGTGTSGAAGIDLSYGGGGPSPNPNPLGFAIAGNLAVYGGSSYGGVHIGDASSKNVYVIGRDNIVAGRLTAQNGSVDVTSQNGGITLTGLTAANAGHVTLTAKGGPISTGDLSASNNYDAHIALDARDSVTTGALTVTSTGTNTSQYATLDITANNVNYGTPLGGAITVNGAINLSAKTPSGHLNYGYATAYANFHNDSSTYTYDGSKPVGSQYTNRGTGGDIILNGALNISAIGQGAGDNTNAYVNFYDSANAYNYNTNQYFSIGGKITTQGINVAATATAHDNVYSPTGTTSSNAYVYATSEGDFNTGTTPAAIVIAASGGDANGNTSSPSSFNTSSLNLQTNNGGDVLLGAVTLGQNGDLTFNARSGRATGSSDFGNIVTGILSNAGYGDHFDQVNITSTGTLMLPNTSLTANNLVLDIGQGNLSFNSLTALNGALTVTAESGGITLTGAATSTNSNYYNTSIALTAKGGAISTSDVSVSTNGAYYYNNGISLNARDSVTTGALTVTATGTGTNTSQYATLDITANNVNYGTPLGGAITVNGAINLSAKTSSGHLNYGYATAYANFHNDSTTYTYDGTQPVGSQYLYRGTGGDIILNGALNISALGQGAGDNTDAHVNFYNSANAYNYNTNQYFSIGGKITTQGINVTATATAHDNTYSPTGTTNSNAYVYATSEGDFNTGTTQAAIVIAASGGDANGNNPFNYNSSSLNLQTNNGGDVLLGAVTLGQNGDLTFNARSGRAAGSTDFGNIVTGTLSNAGYGDHFDQVNITSTGDTSLSSTAITANNIVIDASTISTLNSLTALSGGIGVTVRGGSLVLGDLSASGDYSSAHITLNARDSVTTGALTATAMGTSVYQYATLDITANNVNFGTPLGGAITVNGAINLSAKTPSGHLNYGDATAHANFHNDSYTYTYYGTKPVGNQYTNRGTGGDIILNGALNVSAIGQGYGDRADAFVGFYDSANAYNYNTNQYFSIGGKITTQGINVTATATAHDNTYSPTGTTNATAYVYATSEGDFSTGTTPAAIVIAASGGDANGNNPLNYNIGSLDLRTNNGGDVLLGNVTLGQNGYLSFDANSDRATGRTDLGNVIVGTLNNSGGSDHFDQVNITSTGDTSLGSSAITANIISLDANTLSSLNSLTTLNRRINVTTHTGDLTLGTISTTGGSVYLTAQGGALTVSDVSAQNNNDYYYNGASINLNARDSVTTGALTVTAASPYTYYQNAILDITANNVNFGTPLGGAITVNGPINVSAMTPSGHTQSGYASAAAHFHNDSYTYTYDGTKPAGSQYLYRGTGGDILLNGALNVSAIGQGYGDSTDAHVNFYNSANAYNYNTNQYFSIGGKITTQGINVTATATAHDNTYSPTGTTLANAYVYATSEGDITIGSSSNPQDITISTSGGDANGRTGIYNNSYLDLETYNGGDILAGNITTQDGGAITLVARSDRATGTDLGNITATSLSGGALTLRTVNTTASGTINIGGSVSTTDDFILDSTAGDANIGDVTTQNGKIDVKVRKGHLAAGNLTTHYGGIALDAAGDISTGNLNASFAGNPSLAYITLTANHDLGYGSYGSTGISTGDLSTAGNINVSGSIGDIFIAHAASTAGDIHIDGINGANIVASGSTYLASGAGKQVRLSSDTGSLTIAASSITANDILLSGHDVMISSAPTASMLTGNLAVTVGNTFSIDGVLSGGTGTITQTNATPTGGSTLTGTLDYSNSFTLKGQGNNAVNAVFNSNLMGAVASSGYNLNLTSDQLTIDPASKLHGGDVSLTVNQGSLLVTGMGSTPRNRSATVNVTGGDISGGGNLTTAGALSITAHNGLINLGNLSGSSVALTSDGTNSSVSTNAVQAYNGSAYGSIFMSSQGDITTNALHGAGMTLTSTAGGLMLNGAITGDVVVLKGLNDIGAGTILVNANALSTQSLAGQVNFHNATLNVGTGTVALGNDPILLNNVSTNTPALAPSFASPNAAFDGATGVDFGRLVMSGDYLYVRAPVVADNVGGSNLNITGSLGSSKDTGGNTHDIFYNVVPTANDGVLFYAQQINQLSPDYEVTLALGNNNFKGNITVLTGTPPNAIANNALTPLGLGLPHTDPPFNFVFVTTQTVSGTSNITIPGQVAVLTPAGVTVTQTAPPVTTPPPLASPPPATAPAPGTSTPSNESAAVISSVASNNIVAPTTTTTTPQPTPSSSSSDGGSQSSGSTGETQVDPDAPGTSKEVVKVKDSKPLDMGKSCS